MRHAAAIVFMLLSAVLAGQKAESNVTFADYRNLILTVKKDAMKATGKLTSGELVSVGCEQNVCFFEIEYKDRKLRQPVGDDITRLTISEFDFNSDGDLELVVINDYRGTSFLYVFSYSRGIIMKLFEKEIKYDRIVIRSDYIEHHLPTGMDIVWHYYQGGFWTMTPYSLP